MFKTLPLDFIEVWVDHKLQGKGSITDANGNIRNVTFKDGKIINP